MSEIKIGEYVRTKKGLIANVIGYDDDNNFMLDIGQIITKIEAKNIKNGSNPIDLIKVGDYVNGYEVLEFDDEEVNLYLGIPIYDDALMDCISEVRPLDTIEIKSIVTKEQFKNIEYKVGE